MQNELAALQSYGSPFGDTSALHDSLDVFERKMLHWPFLPDVAMLTARLTERG
jgi:hypothetical protein